jgi:hypothetical protein
MLSTSNRQLVEGYLAWKWGLQANLPLDILIRQRHLLTYKLTLVFPIPTILPGVGKYFDPRKAGTCRLWLDAADPTTIQLTAGTPRFRNLERSNLVVVMMLLDLLEQARFLPKGLTGGYATVQITNTGNMAGPVAEWYVFQLFYLVCVFKKQARP